MLGIEIPGTPVRGTRSFVGIPLAAQFKPLKSILSLRSFYLFFRDSHLSFSRMPVILPVRYDDLPK